MSRKSSQNNAKHNARLAWLAQQVGKGQTDANIILRLMAAFPGTSQKTARAELNEIYKHLWEVEAENLQYQKVKFQEVGWEMLAEMRNALQLGPAANHFKTMAGLAGLTTDNSKSQVDQTVTQGTPAPKPDIVRDRIAKLRSDPKIIERAKKLGLDIDDLKTE